MDDVIRVDDVGGSCYCLIRGNKGGRILVIVFVLVIF